MSIKCQPVFKVYKNSLRQVIYNGEVVRSYQKNIRPSVNAFSKFTITISDMTGVYFREIVGKFSEWGIICSTKLRMNIPCHYGLKYEVWSKCQHFNCACLVVGVVTLNPRRNIVTDPKGIEIYMVSCNHRKSYTETCGFHAGLCRACIHCIGSICLFTLHYTCLCRLRL